MSKITRHSLLNAALKAILAGAETSAVVKIPATFISEIASDLKPEEKKVLVDAKPNELKEVTKSLEIKDLIEKKFGNTEEFLLKINEFQEDQRKISKEILDNTKQIKKTSKQLLGNKELEMLINTISETKKDFENIRFNNKFKLRNNFVTEEVIKISGRDAIKIFIKSLHKILENNVRSGRAFKEDSLNKIFPDGIMDNVRDLKFLLERINKTIEIVKNSEQINSRNVHLFYTYKKFFEYLNENL